MACFATPPSCVSAPTSRRAIACVRPCRARAKREPVAFARANCEGPAVANRHADPSVAALPRDDTSAPAARHARPRRPSTSPISRRSTGLTSDTPRATSSSTTGRSAPWMLPYLRNRPLVMTRYPGRHRRQDRSIRRTRPSSRPSGFAPINIWSEDTQREIRYFVCDDEDSLMYIANLGSIPLHIWASRVGSLELPDWCVIDLDPKEAPFADVIRTAQVLHRLCETIELPNYVKTTGKTGPPYSAPVRPAMYVRAIAHARRAPGALRAARARRHRDDRPPRHQARRQGLSGLLAESPRPDDRRAVQRAAASRRDRLDAAAAGTKSTTASTRKNFTIKNARRANGAPNDRPVRRGARAEARIFRRCFNAWRGAERRDGVAPGQTARASL